MKATVGLLAALVGLGLGGCNLWRDEPALAPRMARTGGEFSTAGGAADEEVSPARPVAPIPRPTEQQRAASAPEATLTRPDRTAAYEARLEEVSPPVAADRPPVPAGPEVESGGGTHLVDAILAEVNGEVITREDILGPLRPQIKKWREELSPEEFKARCRYVVDLKLRRAISERLVVQEAKRLLSEQQKEQVEATLGQILKDLAAEAGSMLLLEERLKLEGTTVEEGMVKERERLLVQRFLREHVAPTIHITHSELLDYYNEVRDQHYVKPTRVRMWLIAIHKAEFPDAAQAQALAGAVRQRAAAGEDFAKLAERYSHGVMAKKGGDWDYLTEGSFRVKAVDDALFALERGRVGPLVETDDAFYIVKAEDRQEGRTVPFTEVQDELEDELRDRRYNEVVSQHIQKLYDRAYVRINRENL
ncbi:MAG TPA: peptidylprolyl isomerase [Phycisphaerae bacterium]|nr:peptidylprolyl isomerase [Phycisphaerae bacterium]